MPLGGGTADNSNTYKVVVQASDGGVTEWVQYFKVTVIVLDLEEEGIVTWTVDADGACRSRTDQTPDVLLEFQAGAILTATVTDPDTTDHSRCPRDQRHVEVVQIVEQHRSLDGDRPGWRPDR